MTFSTCRFKEKVVAPWDTVDYDVVPDVDADGKTLPTSSNKYKWVTGEGDVAWRWAYLNPEDEHRITSWATGLTVNVSLPSTLFRPLSILTTISFL